jgi:DNA-binding CsgD family transcriptional regulator
MALRRVRSLTSTEGRVVSLVAAGRTDAEVAAELGLAEKTVAWHLARAARKLGLRSRSEVAGALAQSPNPTKEEQ